MRSSSYWPNAAPTSIRKTSRTALRSISFRVAVAEAQRLASETFRLVSVNAFKPAPHAGHKMEAKGLLYREPGESRLNLASLQMVGSSSVSNRRYAVVRILEESYPDGMPELSRFFGIVIGVFYREHGRPHFHAVYGEFEAVIDIETGEVISGKLPKRALGLISDGRKRIRRS